MLLSMERAAWLGAMFLPLLRSCGRSFGATLGRRDGPLSPSSEDVPGRHPSGTAQLLRRRRLRSNLIECANAFCINEPPDPSRRVGVARLYKSSKCR